MQLLVTGISPWLSGVMGPVSSGGGGAARKKSPSSSAVGGNAAGVFDPNSLDIMTGDW